MKLAWYKGKYWYYEGKLPNGDISLISLKNSSFGINVTEIHQVSLHICKDPKQYEAVRYFQNQGVAWRCEISM